jgi:hypothetical protein
MNMQDTTKNHQFHLDRQAGARAGCLAYSPVRTSTAAVQANPVPGQGIYKGELRDAHTIDAVPDGELTTDQMLVLLTLLGPGFIVNAGNFLATNSPSLPSDRFSRKKE